MAVRFSFSQHFTQCAPWAGAAAITATLVALLWQPFSLSGESPNRTGAASLNATETQPPWIYGRPDARFTIVTYADFACPYCRQYIPMLQRWIDEHADVNLQWRHLPLPMHGAEAMQFARLAECTGMTHGNAAFWRSVMWIFHQSQPGHSSVPTIDESPDWSEGVRSCMQTTQADVHIQEQIDSATRARILATPTLELADQKTGRTLTLQGMVEGDALLSAIDVLIAPPRR